jgi:hypothetical protein
VRQLLTESILLSALGGALGWGLAFPGAAVIRASFPTVPYPIAFDFTPDGYVLKWTVAVSMVTGMVFGLAPALLASRTDLVAVVKGGAEVPRHAGRRFNLRSALVVAQVTLSIVILVCAGLFIRSLGNARRTDPGFRVDNLVSMFINLDLLGYDSASSRRFYS